MTPLGKFLRVRSGLHEGQRTDYPPVAPWVDRAHERRRREDRTHTVDTFLAFAIIAVGVTAVVWVSMCIVARF